MANTDDWKEALAINNGDYAYSPEGGMIIQEDDGTYTVANGNLDERKGVYKDEIPDTLKSLNMPEDGWSYE